MSTHARVLSLVVALAFTVPAAAAPSPSADSGGSPGATVSASPVKPGPFPKLRARIKARRAERRGEHTEVASRPGPDADTPAGEDAPTGGIWEWVERMDGEIPTAEQQEAIAAHEEEEAAQDAVAEVDLTKSNHPLFLDLVNPEEFDIPIEVTPEVEKWVTYFTGSGRKYYKRWLSRSTRYRPMMYEELEKAGLPRDRLPVDDRVWLQRPCLQSRGCSGSVAVHSVHGQAVRPSCRLVDR